MRDPVRVVVGRIGRPHGVRGEVTVEVRTDEPELRFAPGASLLAGTGTEDASPIPLSIARAAWHSGRLLLTLDAVDDRDAAEALRGRILMVDRPAGAMPEGPDEFYDSDLVGCRVELTDGSQIGSVHEVVHLPAQDLLSVARNEAPDVLVPFTAAFVPIIDIGARRIVIEPPPGLLDLGDSP